MDNKGDLRNDIGATSHGRSLDEIRERNNRVDLLTREFLIDSTLVVAVFLIRAFEGRKELETPIAEAQPEERLDYSETTEFNDLWDDAYGEFVMGSYSYTASEILFNVDYKAYKAEHAAFVADEFEFLEVSEAEPGEPS